VGLNIYSMKVLISKLLSVLFFSITIFSCATSSEKLEGDEAGGKENVVEAKTSLSESEKDSLENLKRISMDQWQKFKDESEAKIMSNKKNLVSLQASIALRSTDMKIVYRKAVAEMSEKNDNLKNRLANYEDGKSEPFTTFKQRFENDVNEIAKSIENIK